MGLAEAATRKVGPLPAWGWGAVVVGGYVAYRVVRGGGSPTTAAGVPSVGAVGDAGGASGGGGAGGGGVDTSALQAAVDALTTKIGNITIPGTGGGGGGGGTGGGGGGTGGLGGAINDPTGTVAAAVSNLIGGSTPYNASILDPTSPQAQALANPDVPYIAAGIGQAGEQLPGFTPNSAAAWWADWLSHPYDLRLVDPAALPGSLVLSATLADQIKAINMTTLPPPPAGVPLNPNLYPGSSTLQAIQQQIASGNPAYPAFDPASLAIINKNAPATQPGASSGQPPAISKTPIDTITHPAPSTSNTPLPSLPRVTTGDAYNAIRSRYPNLSFAEVQAQYQRDVARGMTNAQIAGK